MRTESSIDFKRILRLAVLVACAAVVGVFLGHMVSSYEMRFMLSRKYCGTYRGIEVYKSGSINTAVLLFLLRE